MEPPIRTTPDGPEAEPRRIGHRWIDLVLAGSAILIPVVSVSIAMHHSEVQEELVAANSWPFLRYEHSNSTGGEPLVSLRLLNVGVGPALLKSLQITYEGRPIRTKAELLNACCNYERLTMEEKRRSSILSTTLHSAVVPAGESRTLVALRQEDNPEIWARLDSERWKLQFEACYCSVLHACWRSDLTGLEPERVEHCEVDPARDFQE